MLKCLALFLAFSLSDPETIILLWIAFKFLPDILFRAHVVYTVKLDFSCYTFPSEESWRQRWFF